MAETRNERLIALRTERGWSQHKAAEELGVSQVTWHRWEGGIVPSPDNLDRLREIFGVDLAALGFHEVPVMEVQRVES